MYGVNVVMECHVSHVSEENVISRNVKTDAVGLIGVIVWSDVNEDSVCVCVCVWEGGSWMYVVDC